MRDSSEPHVLALLASCGAPRALVWPPRPNQLPHSPSAPQRAVKQLLDAAPSTATESAPAGGWMGLRVTNRLGAPGGSGCSRLAQYVTHTAALRPGQEQAGGAGLAQAANMLLPGGAACLGGACKLVPVSSACVGSRALEPSRQPTPRLTCRRRRQSGPGSSNWPTSSCTPAVWTGTAAPI